MTMRTKIVDSIIQEVITLCPDDEILKEVIEGLRKSI